MAGALFRLFIVESYLSRSELVSSGRKAGDFTDLRHDSQTFGRCMHRCQFSLRKGVSYFSTSTQQINKMQKVGGRHVKKNKKGTRNAVKRDYKFPSSSKSSIVIFIK